MDLGHWEWNGPDFSLDDWYGFVYHIHNIKDNKTYIGKKAFWLRKSKPPLKGKKNRRIYWVENDWKYYTGSSEELNKDMSIFKQESFSFEIISIWKWKSSLWYAEIKEIILSGALEDPIHFYNGSLPAMKFRPKIEDKGLWQ